MLQSAQHREGWPHQTGLSRASGWIAMTFGPAPIDPERTYWPFILLIAAILIVMVGALLVFFA